MQAVTRVKLEQASKVKVWMPTRLNNGEGRSAPGKQPTRAPVTIHRTWEGAWEFDQMSGSGRVTLGKDGRLKGVIRIKDGDSSTFVAERAIEPDEPIPAPPSYRDKWRRRW